VDSAEAGPCGRSVCVARYASRGLERPARSTSHQNAAQSPAHRATGAARSLAPFSSPARVRRSHRRAPRCGARRDPSRRFRILLARRAVTRAALRVRRDPSRRFRILFACGAVTGVPQSCAFRRSSRTDGAAIARAAYSVASATRRSRSQVRERRMLEPTGTAGSKLDHGIQLCMNRRCLAWADVIKNSPQTGA
jgi:hypothetical protein